MANIEPGIYRIVNVRYGTAITILANNTLTIANWETPRVAGQQWLIQCSGHNYHISDCVHGRHIMAESGDIGAKANLGCYPTLWEIIPIKEMTYAIKLVHHDLVLSSHGGENGAGIHVWPRDLRMECRAWKFERLWGLPENISAIVRPEAVESDRIMLEDQRRVIHDLKKQLEEKDQQLAHANREIKYLLGRLVQREELLPVDRMTATNDLSEGTIQEELALLREKVERLESRLS